MLTKQRQLVKCKKENLFELDTKSILHRSRVVITCTPRQGHVLLAVTSLYNEQMCMGTWVGSGPPGSSGQGTVRMARDVLGEDACERQRGESVGVGTKRFQCPM